MGSIKWIIIVVFIVATFFRFFQLSSVPPSPSLDEATIGFNAYSLLQTGRDEYGYKLPILLRAYDDYRPALYVYLVVPFIKLIGVNVMAVRLPSVIMSTVVVIAAFFLPLLLFGKFNQRHIIAIFSSFLLAISPWHIYISRLGHEVNAGLTFIVLGALFFVASNVHQKFKWSIILSLVFFALSFYTYQSEKVFTPLFVLLLTFCFWRELWANKKNLFIAIAAGLILFIPIFNASLSPEALIRLQGTSAFSNLDSEYFATAKQLVVDKQQRNFVGEVIHNRRLVPIRVFIGNYFSHLNPQWLFSNSGNDSFKAPNLGLFYQWEILALVFGAFSLLLVKNKKVKILLFGWIGIALIAPSITTQAPHAMRAFNMLPAPQIIEAIGLAKIAFFFKEKFRYTYIRYGSYLVIFLFIVVIFLSGFSFFINYFYYFPHQQSESFTYALTAAMPYVSKHKNEYKKIVFSNEDNLYQSYMFFLFLTQYNPSLYLSEGGTKSGGFARVHTFDKFEFRPIKWDKEEKNNVLFVGNPKDFPTNVQSNLKFYYLDGKQGISIVHL